MRRIGNHVRGDSEFLSSPGQIPLLIPRLRPENVSAESAEVRKLYSSAESRTPDVRQLPPSGPIIFSVQLIGEMYDLIEIKDSNNDISTALQRGCSG